MWAENQTLHDCKIQALGTGFRLLWVGKTGRKDSEIRGRGEKGLLTWSS